MSKILWSSLVLQIYHFSPFRHMGGISIPGSSLVHWPEPCDQFCSRSREGKHIQLLSQAFCCITLRLYFPCAAESGRGLDGEGSITLILKWECGWCGTEPPADPQWTRKTRGTQRGSFRPLRFGGCMLQHNLAQPC